MYFVIVVFFTSLGIRRSASLSTVSNKITYPLGG